MTSVRGLRCAPTVYSRIAATLVRRPLHPEAPA
jgi:hypothetical protein